MFFWVISIKVYSSMTLFANSFSHLETRQFIHRSAYYMNLKMYADISESQKPNTSTTTGEAEVVISFSTTKHRREDFSSSSSSASEREERNESSNRLAKHYRWQVQRTMIRNCNNRRQATQNQWINLKTDNVKYNC